MMYDRMTLRLAGEQYQFLYNRDKKEVYNPLFPGIPVHKLQLHCGHTLDHNTMAIMIAEKIHNSELEHARAQLSEAINNFNDYGIS